MKTVFFDVDTQIDFLYPSGALYVPGAGALVPQIAELNGYAAANGITVVSTMDAHSENDPEFTTWPPHCVVETTGQQKPASTLTDKRVTIPNAPCDLGAMNLGSPQQILLQKQMLDCFTNVNLPKVLAQLGADRYVVYGVVTEVCVQFAASGLLKTGKRVELVTDAIQGLDDANASKMKASFVAAGGVLTTAAKVMGN